MLDMNKTVLMITACVKPTLGTFQLSLTNADCRLEQYIESIKWSIEKTAFVKIVFVDNSGYPVNSALIDYAKQRGKSLEWLSFLGNEKMIALCGKGYGEGEMIEYGLKYSELLKDATYFCKLTGRLKVENINRFIKLAKMDQSYFWTMGLNWKNKRSDAIETRFYGIPIKTYKDIFIEAYKNVDDKTGVWLEKTFYRKYCAFDTESQSLVWYPDFTGQSGSMGIDYKLSREQLIAKTFAAGAGLYRPRKMR